MKDFLLFLETIAIHILAFPSTATFSFQFLACIIIIVIFSFTDADNSRENRGKEEPFSLLFTTFNQSQIFRHFFANLKLE